MSEENKIPSELLYTKEHEWVRVEEDGIITIGITDFAMSSLGDIVYVELDVNEGDFVEEGDTFGSIEAVKTVSDLFMPISGEILEFNKILENNPESINDSVYDDGWIIKVKANNINDISKLLSDINYKEEIGA